MIKETLNYLIDAFPGWEEQLSKSTPGKDGEFVVVSPKSEASLIFSISDRINIKFGRENLEFFHALESIETLKDIVSDNLVAIEYYCDRQLAERLGQDVPSGIPDYQGGDLVNPDTITNKNSDWYFANKLRVVSWSGSLDRDIEAVYGQ
ncbi:hypothetical protein ACJJI5_11060 [Microbulbifer sp. EKSA008]|uniref:hypothetical protein n=1 Tax=Microbulbifer sp. EKSA008 TaxID=3243367 RepID=UPI00404228DE